MPGPPTATVTGMSSPTPLTVAKFGEDLLPTMVPPIVISVIRAIGPMSADMVIYRLPPG